MSNSTGSGLFSSLLEGVGQGMVSGFGGSKVNPSGFASNSLFPSPEPSEDMLEKMRRRINDISGLTPEQKTELEKSAFATWATGLSGDNKTKENLQLLGMLLSNQQDQVNANRNFQEDAFWKKAPFEMANNEMRLKARLYEAALSRPIQIAPVAQFGSQGNPVPGWAQA